MDTYVVKQLFKPIISQQYKDQFLDLIWLNQAYGKMLVRQDLLRESDFQVIEQGLTKVARELRETDLEPERIDLYNNVMTRLSQEVGEETAQLLHLGRSRNDIGATCRRMQIRREILKVVELLDHTMDVILRAAEENLDTVMTFYTYGQPSQPGTYAHYLLAVWDSFARDHDRFVHAYDTTNCCPLGAAAGTGTSYPIDRQYLADLLGFDSVIDNSLDAVSGTDYLLELEMALTLMMTKISQIAQDFIFWSSEENHILEFENSVVTGSSIMPQKQNPICLEHMRALSAKASSTLLYGIDMCRNTSWFPSSDTYLYQPLDYSRTIPEVLKALELLQLVLTKSHIRRERALYLTQTNQSGATALAEYLAQTNGITFTEGHHLAGQLIRGNAAADGINLSSIEAAMDPIEGLKRKQSGGTPRREDTAAMLSRSKKILDDQRKWRQEKSMTLQ